ncbi:PAS domain-containing sensor histidine kinase [Natronomonas gomsonensis]|uniref:sensor histidine kinase n=1 Tax=Natronomonas gomsonensis TaxID=1046043 RepID=UPI0020CA7C40|nr:PAS domain-containing sensor histidine kinase [Natronomonas gomsonensis]MCY4729966.1 PAS domain-containing sensor histidine kinase [Natronomonas gomsonensis]
MPDYHELFEKIPDGITLHDTTDGSLLDANEQFCEMLGYTREELLELRFEDIILDEPPYTSERAEEYIQNAATDGPQTFEWRDITKAGDPLPVEVHLRQTTIDGKQRILAVVRDITDRKQRERELQRKNERLEEFASVVSHDLRNPLNVAQGWLDLAREECDSEHLTAIERAHDRMDTLIEDLLTLARDGETTMELENVVLADITARCWENVETAAATVHIQTTQTIRADYTRLQQLLENLMRNATQHGGEDATVTVGELADGFFLEDNGPGIPEETRTRVFEAGYTTSAEGTGFGLKIVNEVAVAHGWDITVTEAETGGARFEITNVTLSE